MILKRYGFKLSDKGRLWFCSDGKELKGSILKGDKRGEAIVQVLSHSTREVAGECFYNGSKESEIPTMRELLKSTGIEGQKVSMDALHLNPKTLGQIETGEGYFLVGLKSNQKELLSDMKFVCRRKSYYSRVEHEKGHGRIEYRKYDAYKISEEWYDPRWKGINFNTLICVERKRKIVITGNQTHDFSYFLSNMKTKNVQVAEELFDAIRNHWQVEVNNNVRDCSLKEDKLRCIDTRAGRVIASCRTLVIKLLNQADVKNKCAQLDYFADHFSKLLPWLRSVNFL